MQALKHAIYWRETEPVTPRQALRGHDRADVAIVGAGFTGLWTAHFLKQAEPGLDVAVVETEWAGAGASGHNDGFAMTVLDMSLHHLVAKHGPEAAGAAHAAVARSIAEIGEFCDRNSLDAEYEPNGFVAVATNDGERWRLDRDLEAAQAIGVADEFEMKEGDAAREVIGSPIVRTTLRERAGALVNPHKLARGLARVVERQGVRIYEGSPALEVEPGRVRTPRGVLEAERIAVTTNAYQQQLRQWRRKTLPLWSYAMVSEPLSDEQLGKVAWPGREGFEDKRNYITIGRLTADNRILWGGREAPYFYGNDMCDHHMRDSRVYDQLREAWRDFFPQLGDVRFTHAYGGAVAMTVTFVPYFGSLGGGLFYGFGYNGHGVAPSHTGGKVLSDLLTGRDSEYTQLLFVNAREPGLPAEPLRYLGTRLTTRLLMRQDRQFERGRGGDAMDPWLLRVLQRTSG